MAQTQIGVDSDFLGNSLLNKGVESMDNGVVFSPTTLSANVNDYSPIGLNLASFLKLSSTLAVSITGLNSPSVTNKFLYLYNNGTFNITLVNKSVSSLAQNRFEIGEDIVMSPKSGVTLFYDVGTSRWICLGRTTNSVASTTITGGVTLSGQVIFNGDITDTINANTNNYNPVGLANANRLLLNCAGAFNLTGIQAQAVGATYIIINTNNVNSLTIVNNSAASLGANRFLIGANVVLTQNQSCMIQYDLTNARWRMISHL